MFGKYRIGKKVAVLRFNVKPKDTRPYWKQILDEIKKQLERENNGL